MGRFALLVLMAIVLAGCGTTSAQSNTGFDPFGGVKETVCGPDFSIPEGWVKAEESTTLFNSKKKQLIVYSTDIEQEMNLQELYAMAGKSMERGGLVLLGSGLEKVNKRSTLAYLSTFKGEGKRPAENTIFLLFRDELNKYNVMYVVVWQANTSPEEALLLKRSFARAVRTNFYERLPPEDALLASQVAEKMIFTEPLAEKK